MDTPPSTASEATDTGSARALLLVAAALWLVTGAVFRWLEMSSDDWLVAFLAYIVVLMVSATVASLAVATYTSEPGAPSGPRIAALVLAVVATASTLVAWAFVLWAVLLAAGFAALAATGSPQRRHAGWLGAPLLGGVVAAIVAVNAELGPPGSHGDHSEAQGWANTVSCILVSVGFGVLARGARTPHGSATPAPAV